MRTRSLAALSMFTMAALAACAAPADEESDAANAEVNSLESYWADAKKLDLSDLTRLTVGFATDGINDGLSSGHNGVNVEAPEVFGISAEPNKVLPKNAQIQGLDTIVSGLAAQYGESELGTQVNTVRLNHLKTTGDKYYVESAFTAKAGVGKDWNFGAGGFGDTSITLGIQTDADLTSRVIVASDDDKLSDLVNAPLDAAKAARGFVFPRTLAEVKSMKPGEMFALRGLGKLGANFGVGAPLLVADPTAGLAYRILVSAGVAGVIGGQLDVQLVRMEGDEVVVDVGVQSGKGVSFYAAIHDGFGIKGICDDGTKCLRTVTLGSKQIDLGKMVMNAVQKRVTSYIAVDLHGQASTADSRVSVSRFHFHLDKGNSDEVEKALQQALKFDVRLAQALYNRDLDQANPAVYEDFDAVRAATTSTKSFGFGLLGIGIYHRAVVEKTGSFILQTPDGTKSILFDSLTKDGGWFSGDHSFTRTGIAAETVDTKNPDNFKSEANLFAQAVMGDKHMNNDEIIDNVDATLVGLFGPSIIDALDKAGNAMQRLVWSTCPAVEKEADNGTTSKSFDEQCNVTLLASPQMTALKAAGMASVESLIKSLPSDYQDLARNAASTRLTLQSVGIHNFDSANGPNVSYSINVRLDDAALAQITSKTKEQYVAGLREYLTVTTADRMKVGAGYTKDQVRADVDKKYGNNMGLVGDVFVAKAHAYKIIGDAEKLIPSTLAGKKYVSYPLGLRFSINSDDSKTYASGVIDSTSNDRAHAATSLFDDLKAALDKRIDAPLHQEQHTVYSLLPLVTKDSLDVAADVKADVKSDFWVKRERYLAAGFKSATSHATGHVGLDHLRRHVRPQRPHQRRWQLKTL